MTLHARPRFYLDIEEEAEYLTRQAGETTARRWQAAVQNTVAHLLLHPGAGRPRADLKPPGLRSWRVEHFRRWLIFYAVEGETLTLYRVRYGMMDLPALDFDPPA